jgi:hypothetical protein
MGNFMRKWRQFGVSKVDRHDRIVSTYRSYSLRSTGRSIYDLRPGVGMASRPGRLVPCISRFVLMYFFLSTVMMSTDLDSARHVLSMRLVHFSLESYNFHSFCS